MDSTLIIIIVAIVVLIIIIVAVLLSIGGEKKPLQSADASTDGVANEVATNKRIQQVLSDANLNGEAKVTKEEILTKYTQGSGEGIPEVEKLLEGDPNNVDLLDWLAFMYYSNGDMEKSPGNIDKAIETYKRALSIKPDNENQHYYLANSYFKKGMMADARKEWNEVIRLNPNSKIAKNAQERINYLNSQGK